jgi:3-oxoacyl-[acyl-carrier-protein] synthase-3
MVVGADVNSRAGDPYDRDLMIFADGAGAVIVEGKESETPIGILSHAERTDAVGWAELLVMEPSLNPEHDQTKRYIRMQGHKVYVYALQNVPGVAKDALDKAGLHLSDIKKVLIATIPTMYDMIKKNKMNGHEIKSGDNIIFTSVGAGMNINAVIYREP